METQNFEYGKRKLVTSKAVILPEIQGTRHGYLRVQVGAKLLVSLTRHYERQLKPGTR